MPKKTYMQFREDDLRKWASNALNVASQDPDKRVLESIQKNPFQGFSERLSTLEEIMRIEGGISPCICRMIFMGAALNWYKIITMREMNHVLRIMGNFIPEGDGDLETRFRDHSFEILMKTWDRAEEIGTVVYQMRKKLGN